MNLKAIVTLLLLILMLIPSWAKAGPPAESVKANFSFFSKLLIYPLQVHKELHIENGGEEKFVIEVKDQHQRTILVLNSSSFSSTTLIIPDFQSGKYFIKCSTTTEVHQIEIRKE